MTDLLERLKAANLAADDDPAPPWEDTRRRLAPAPRPRRRPRRTLALGGAVAALAVAATFVVDAADTPRRAPLGVLQAAAATAAADTRFSGYTAETRVDIDGTPAGPGTGNTTWAIVRPVSGTEYEGRLESLQPVRRGPLAPPLTVPDGVEQSSRREGDRVRYVQRWRQPYGTMFQGIPAFFGPDSRSPAVTVPTDPDEVTAAVAGWAAGRTPANLHPEFAALIKEAGRSDIARTLLYAGDVLTAPRVSPDVRSAVFRALSRVAGVKVDPRAEDALGRPAAALVAEDTDGKSRTRSELLIDPATARILAERHVFTPEPGVNEGRGKHEPPYAAGREETTYRYED